MPSSSSPRGVKYVFGNSASEDAQFYEALVDRPQLKYILTPHEGPGAAMAAGYIKASGEPAIVMQAGVVGMANAIGQMFNAFKEQTPLVFYCYRTDQIAARRARRLRGGRQPGADRPADHQIHLARAPRRHDPRDGAPRVQGGVDAALRPSYVSWHSDFNDERVRTEIIAQEQSIRACGCGPIPPKVERAAKLLVEARMPLMVVGDEIYKAKAVAKAVKLAELLGMPVTQARQLYANFPEDASALGRQSRRQQSQVARLSEEPRRRHQCRQQVAAQRPGADRAARAEVHRHAHRLLAAWAM